MNKKYLSISSLALLAFLAGGALSGCSLQLPGQSAQNRAPAATAPKVPAEQAPIESATVTAPVITDAELDQEIKDLDASLETVKTTGFEQENLSDKDLGL